MDKEIILKIRELNEKGTPKYQIAKELNTTFSSVKYYTSAKYDDIFKRQTARGKTDEEFAQIVKELVPKCNSLNHICALLGLRGVEGYYKKIRKIIEANNLDTSHFGTLRPNKYDSYVISTDEDFFSENTNRTGRSLLKRLITNDYKEYKCEECGLNEWKGKEISLQIHHRNGNHYDNRLENLQILCPNCHSQTDTYARKNITKNIKDNFSFTKHVTERLKCTNENELSEIKINVNNATTNTNHRTHTCLICNKNFISKTKKQKYCSLTCAKKGSIKHNLSKEDIIQAITNAKSWFGAGKLLGISDNGLRKLTKRLHIFDEVKEILKK